MFQDQTLYIHKKRGYLDQDIIAQCDVPDAEVFNRYPKLKDKKPDSGGG